MGTFSDTDKTVLNIPRGRQDLRDARDERAYWETLAFAKARPDFTMEQPGAAAEWAADIMLILGLRVPAEDPKPSTRFETEHGTQAGWRWHRRRNETPCPPCFAGHEKHLRDTAPANPRGPYGPRKNAAECGTRGGYEKHKRDGEPICDECKENRRVEEREARARRKARDAAGMPRASKKPRGIQPERAEYLRRFVAEATGQEVTS